MNVGDYVRTNSGIGKIKENGGEIIKYCVGTLYGISLDRNCLDREVLKSSPNIIDLIEENDIVNHSRVVCIGVSTDLSGTHKYLVLENGSNCANGNIKSIVTKEQFEAMKYEIK